jgi:hypothetical protein
VYTDREAEKLLSEAFSVMTPLVRAVYVHHSELFAGKPAWSGSPSSEVASQFEVWTVAFLPVILMRLAKSSFAGRTVTWIGSETVTAPWLSVATAMIEYSPTGACVQRALNGAVPEDVTRFVPA